MRHRTQRSDKARRGRGTTRCGGASPMSAGRVRCDAGRERRDAIAASTSISDEVETSRSYTGTMSAEITLVQEIEKYPCLYNNNLPEYNRKDLAEEAWMEVANNNNLTVSECKEKWRNIRCSFLRSLKPSTKYKKPYYLTAYLQFVLPFMKSLNNLDVVEESQTNESAKSNPSIETVISAVKSEPEDLETQSDEGSVTMETPVTVTETVTTNTILTRQQPSEVRKRRRPMPMVTKTFLDKKNKKSKFAQGLTVNSFAANRGSNSAVRYFLLSLLPELESMSDEQMRLFKIKVMLLIDELKTNDLKVRESINSVCESERLQKRLINLLLKNLNKTF